VTSSAAAFEDPMQAISMYMKKIVIENRNTRKYKSQINFVINLHLKYACKLSEWQRKRWHH